MEKAKLSIFSLSFFLFLLIILNLIPSQSMAGWDNLGLYGGQIFEIAIDPDDPEKMFAGAYYGGGLFVTTDGGTNWSPILTGAEGTAMDGESTFRNTAVWSVKIAPSTDGNSANNLVWAVHNYWAEKSTDGGSNWTHIKNSTMQGSDNSDRYRYCRSLAIDPSDPSTIYVGTGGTSSSNYKGAIYKTEDSGITWTKMGVTGTFCAGTDCKYSATLDHEFYSSVVDIAIHPTDSNIIWALDFNEDSVSGFVGFLYISTNAGQTWSRVPGAGLAAYIGEQGLAVKPNEPNVLFIASWYGIARVEFPKDGDGNVLWSNSPSITYPVTGTSGKSVRAIAFDPNDPDILYAADNYNRFGKSTNGGLSFPTTWYTGKPFLALTPHPTNSNVVYGGERLLGIYKGEFGSSDYAWTPINNGVNSIMVNDFAVDRHDSTHLLAATMAGVYEKQGENSWTATAALRYTQAFSVAFDPSDETGSSYYAGAEGQLEKTTNNGQSWDIKSNVLPLFSYVNNIVLDPNNPSKLYVTTDTPGGVYKCIESGSTLTLTSITPSGTSFDYNAIAIDPTDSNHIYAGGGNFTGSNEPGNLYEGFSSDEGTTWTWSDPPILEDVIVNAILIDKVDPDIIYVGCGGGSSFTDVPLYKSTDGGTSWIKSYEGIPVGPSRYGIWGSSSTDIFVIRYAGNMQLADKEKSISHYGPSEWTAMDVGISTPLYDLWGSSGSDVFAVGESGHIVLYDGLEWSELSSGTTEDLHGVWGNSGSSVFAVGNNGKILYYDGNWSAMDSGIVMDLRSVWGSDGEDVYAVGAYGTVLHYDGDTWSDMPSCVTGQLQDIWGSSGSDIFSVGESGSIIYYDGSSWSPMSSGITENLYGVWGSSSSDVWAVGDSGTILHYNGSSWSSISSGTTERLYAVWGSASDNIYASGISNAIIEYNESTWEPVIISDGAKGNSVTDLVFSPKDINERYILYASTDRQGIFASTNEARNWVNMGAPPYALNAISSGSVYVGGDAGAYTLDGEGILYGLVKNASGSPLNSAKVSTAPLGKYVYTNSSGEWLMHIAAGSYSVTASKTGYISNTQTAPVYDATFTYVDYYLNGNSSPTNISLSGTSIAENQAIGTTVGALSSTDPNPGDTHTYSLVSGTGSTDNASFTISGSSLRSNVMFNYELKNSYSISVRSTDSGGLYYDKVFTISVINVDEVPPVAVNDSASTNEDTPVIINVIANDTDADGTINVTTVNVTAQPGHGTAGVNPTTGEVTYTPASNYNGSDSFTYTVKDNANATSNGATVAITVNAVNDAPVAVNDSAGTNEDTSVIINVTSNDTDVDGSINVTTVNVTAQPGHGTAGVNPTTGEVTYTPALNYNGSDSFTYTVKDNASAMSNSATVSITVNDINDAPVANNDTSSTNNDSPVIISVTANDTDVDGAIAASTVNITSQPTRGSAIADGTGHVAYTPDPDYSGLYSFTYTVNDDDGAVSNEATVTVTVTDVTPPSPPEGVSAVLSGTDSVIISWLPNEENDLAGYLIYYGKTQGGPYTESSPFIPETETEYTIEGLGGGTWYFVMIAQDSAGNQSGFSEEVSARIVKGMPWLPLLLE
jgi:hypothetical protein